MPAQQHDAQALLVRSYRYSAERISAAVNGCLKVSNSLDALPPAPPGHDVIGVCGQGGRHVYFRLAMSDLEAAVNRILAVTANIAAAIDDIADVCRELRQQTLFDTGSGCVNDSIPSMVPLLPPGEIWCNTGELPLDVWRLLSFEIDVVSSAVVANTGVADFAFSANTPSAFALRAMLGQLGGRRVSFQLTPSNFPANWTSHLANSGVIQVSLARLYFEAGRLLTPLAADDHTPWYAALRYLHWIDDRSPELRVRRDFKRTSIDSRYRGVFAEETAVGLMAVTMSDVLGATMINNAVEWIASSGLGPYPAKKPIADFIAEAIDPVTGKAMTIVAESKGSLGAAVSPKRQRRAESQLDKTHAFIRGTGPVLPVAFCSSIRFTGDVDATQCLAIDPPSNDDVHQLVLDPVDGWRVAYAQALRLIGLERSAREVQRGVPASTLRAMDFDREVRAGRRDERAANLISEAYRRRLYRTDMARKLFGVELLLDAGECAIGIDHRVLGVLRRGIGAEEASALSAIAHEPDQRLFRSSNDGPFDEATDNASFDTYNGRSFGTSLGIAFIFYSDLLQ